MQMMHVWHAMPGNIGKVWAALWSVTTALTIASRSQSRKTNLWTVIAKLATLDPTEKPVRPARFTRTSRAQARNHALVVRRAVRLLRWHKLPSMHVHAQNPTIKTVRVIFARVSPDTAGLMSAICAHRARPNLPRTCMSAQIVVSMKLPTEALLPACVKAGTTDIICTARNVLSTHTKMQWATKHAWPVTKTTTPLP